MKDEALPLLLIMLGGLVMFALVLAATVALVVMFVRSQRRSQQSKPTP